MKKIALVFGVAAFLAFASCKKEEKEVNIESDGVDTTVIVDETTPPPTTDTVVIKQEESDGTSVNINADGVSVDSKDGSKKTNVNVTKDGAGVEIKK